MRYAFVSRNERGVETIIVLDGAGCSGNDLDIVNQSELAGKGNILPPRLWPCIRRKSAVLRREDNDGRRRRQIVRLGNDGNREDLEVIRAGEMSN